MSPSEVFPKEVGFFMFCEITIVQYKELDKNYPLFLTSFTASTSIYILRQVWNFPNATGFYINSPIPVEKSP